MLYKSVPTSGVTHLHHANTVITSASFLRRRELISRGIMDHLGLNQTVQSSDANDKARGVYFDIFLDTVDIHARAKRRNLYGPVLFKLSVEKMLKLNLPPLWVTRSNPIKWLSTTKHSDRWFVDFNELSNNFVVGRFDQMVVLRHMGGILPIHSCLDEVVLDDPEMKHPSVDFYSLSLGAMMLAAADAKKAWNVGFEKRLCPPTCKCIGEYRKNGRMTVELYVPHRTGD
jgi:hypothetical protein